MINQKYKAFSLIELSIVILIIGILVAGVTQSSRLIKQMRLQTARQLTNASPVASISNLNLWLETTLEKSFNENETSDGGSLSKWYDISPTNTFRNDAFQATTANSPLYKSNDSLPVVNFNGNDNGHFFNLPDNTIPSGDSAYTVFLALRFPKDALPKYHDAISAGQWVNPVLIMRVQNQTGFQFVNFSGGGSSTVYTTPTSSQPYDKFILFTANYKNTSQRTLSTYINGTLSSTSNVADARTTGTGFNRIGGNGWAPNDYFKGDIAEIIIFSKFLSNEERQSVENYIMKKWSIK